MSAQTGSTPSSIPTTSNSDRFTKQSTSTTGATVTSPDQELPGAFHPDTEQSGHDLADTSNQYPTSQQFIQNASDKVKQYLPESVAGSNAQGEAGVKGGSLFTEHPEGGVTEPPKESGATGSSAESKAYTLPSKETPSGSPVGVGSLPGTLSEVSVAKLPEERRQEVLPSQETDRENLGKTGGVGSLPGGPSESGVAVLPEERSRGAEEVKTPLAKERTNGSGVSPTQAAEQGAGKTGGVGAQNGELKEAGGPASQESGHNMAGLAAVGSGHKEQPSEKVTEHTDQPTKTQKAEQGAQEGTEHTDQPTKTQKAEQGAREGTEHTDQPSKTQKAKQGAQEAKEKVATKLPGHSDPATTSEAPKTTPPPAAPTSAATTDTAPGGRRASTGNTGAPHKVGFMEKVKGEAMVISGKLGKNEKKVEEGKHLMGK